MKAASELFYKQIAKAVDNRTQNCHFIYYDIMCSIYMVYNDIAKIYHNENGKTIKIRYSMVQSMIWMYESVIIS